MTLFGLSPAAFFWTLIAVSGAVAALYLLRMRLRTLQVPFAPLWRAAVGDREATHLFRRLRRWLSMLLQLLLALLLVSALARPERTAGAGAAKVVILIDRSASMKAPASAGQSPSRIELARERAGRLVTRLGRRVPVMVLAVDHRIVPLAGFADEPEVALAGIERLEASDACADTGAALRFAAQVLEAVAGTVVLIDDGAEPADGLPETITLVRDVVGAELPNVAITLLAARRSPAGGAGREAMISVANFADEPAD